MQRSLKKKSKNVKSEGQSKTSGFYKVGKFSKKIFLCFQKGPFFFFNEDFYFKRPQKYKTCRMRIKEKNLPYVKISIILMHLAI